MIYKIQKKDWQYVLPSALIICFFISTDILINLNKLDLAYFSAVLFKAPYRMFTSHFTHADFGHLLSNLGGIVVSRFFFSELKVKSNTFFILFIAIAMPLQSYLQWLCDIYIFNNPLSFLIGFSGVLYAVLAFILLSSIYGKNRFLFLNIGLKPSFNVRRSSSVITGIGFLWSLQPGISISGHFTGFIAGTILFFL